MALPNELLVISSRSSLFIGPAAVDLSSSEASRIGHKIWQNECDGTVAGLTSWNAGENFASFGIGHFIWYPEGYRGPFEESFPPLVRFMKAGQGREPLAFFSAPCPWRFESRFFAAQQSREMRQLRDLLADTVDLQTQFLINRLEDALPKLLAEADPANARKLEKFRAPDAVALGLLRPIDYVNFKGEGTLATERYAGQGWGLLQVLEQMPRVGEAAPKQFSRGRGGGSAPTGQKCPSERHEDRWLSGWIRRVNGYSRT